MHEGGLLCDNTADLCVNSCTKSAHNLCAHGHHDCDYCGHSLKDKPLYKSTSAIMKLAELVQCVFHRTWKFQILQWDQKFWSSVDHGINFWLKKEQPVDNQAQTSPSRQPSKFGQSINYGRRMLQNQNKAWEAELHSAGTSNAQAQYPNANGVMLHTCTQMHNQWCWDIYVMVVSM